jgi:hypothetical protein
MFLYPHKCCHGNHAEAPEKYQNLMLDEPNIMESITKWWGVYYMLSRENDNRNHYVYDPDGEMKGLLIPLQSDASIDHFETIIGILQECYPLESWGKDFLYEYSHGYILYFNEDIKVIDQQETKFVLINCFLKHLIYLVEALKSVRIIDLQYINQYKEYRAVIDDSTAFSKNNMNVNLWVSERGFNWFALDIYGNGIKQLKW